MKKVAFVGASVRICAFALAIKEKYSSTHELCAVMDVDKGKGKSFNEFLGVNMPYYGDFDQMCEEAKPDLLLISTVDYYHCEYILKALAKNIPFICEKPLCVNIEQCREIVEAVEKTPDVFAATSHNARYHIAARTVKKLLDEGAIGKINSVDYAEMLDFDHGSSYFHRWNSRKKLSGGLQIHKSSHHFDKINWWISSRVKSLSAYGGLKAYGAAASPFHGEKCCTCEHKDECRFAVNYKNTNYINFDLYMNNKSEGSYLPDLCVFSPDVDIEDFLSVGMKYENGVYANYTLAAHCNYEGETIIFEGDKGRIEMTRRRIAGKNSSKVMLFRFGMEPEEMKYEAEAGTHGGADNKLFEDLFGDENSGKLATLEDGIQAVLTGIAVNEALKTGETIDVQELL